MTRHDDRFRLNAALLGMSALLASLAAGCEADPKRIAAMPKVERIEPIVLVEMTCPVTGETVTVDDEIAFFESYPVYCKGRDGARQFASLELKQRARLGAEQVLAQKGISNATCPITGETLTAAASPVLYEGVAIGFASAADANQFRSLKAERKAALIAAWREQEAEEEEASQAGG